MDIPQAQPVHTVPYSYQQRIWAISQFLSSAGGEGTALGVKFVNIFISPSILNVVLVLGTWFKFTTNYNGLNYVFSCYLGGGGGGWLLDCVMEF